MVNWYECVNPTHKKYWRMPAEATANNFTGYKRGTRIWGVIMLAGTQAKLALYEADGLMAYNSTADKTKAEAYMNQFSAGMAYKIMGITYDDYDIGFDAWPIGITCALGVISLFFIITLKFSPKCANKMYKKCPKLLPPTQSGIEIKSSVINEELVVADENESDMRVRRYKEAARLAQKNQMESSMLKSSIKVASEEQFDGSLKADLRVKRYSEA